MTDTIKQAKNELETTLKNFMPHQQARTLKENLNGAEAAGFADCILTLAELDLYFVPCPVSQAIREG